MHGINTYFYTIFNIIYFTLRKKRAFRRNVLSPLFHFWRRSQNPLVWSGEFKDSLFLLFELAITFIGRVQEGLPLLTQFPFPQRVLHSYSKSFWTTYFNYFSFIQVVPPNRKRCSPYWQGLVSVTTAYRELLHDTQFNFDSYIFHTFLRIVENHGIKPFYAFLPNLLDKTQFVES